MATRKPRSSKPATKKPTTKATPATDEAVDGPDATEAAPTPADVPEAVSVDDAPNGGEVQVEDQQDGGSPGEAIEAEAEVPAQDATPEESEQDSPDQAAEDATSEQSPQDPTEEQAVASSDVITRKYKGVVFQLHPQPDGTFKLGDQTFKSLTAAAQFVLNVTGGVSGPRWWLGASTSGTGKGGSRLTPEEQAVRDAERALKAQERALKAKAKADEAARKAAAKAAEEAKRTEAAFNTMIGLLMAAAREGRLTTAQVSRRRSDPGSCRLSDLKTNRLANRPADRYRLANRPADRYPRPDQGSKDGLSTLSLVRIAGVGDEGRSRCWLMPANPA